MAVTQYIGARYVPIIFQNPDDNSNDWKAGIAYEPLTIVSYAGGSYTSKTAVPAGASNPVDAPEYWVAIGLYSGQTAINTNSITQIRHALAAATEAGYVCTSARAEGDYVWIAGALYECTAAVAVDEAYTEGINITPVDDFIHDTVIAINNLGNRVSTAEGDISDLSGDITTLQTNLEAKIANVAGYNNFSSRKVICISDSYGLVPSLAESWIGKFQSLTGIPNANFYRSQINGSGYVGLNANTFLVQLTNIVNTLSADEKLAITDVIVGGSYNDADFLKQGGSVSDVYAAPSAFCQYARLNLPNATIRLFNPAWSVVDCSVHKYIRFVTQALQEAARGNTRVSYIDNIYWCHRQALLDGTGYHPNAIAGGAIAASIISSMLSGSPFCNMAPSGDGFINPSLQPSAEIASGSLIWNNIRQLYDDSGTAHAFFGHLGFKTGSAWAPAGQLEIGTFTDGIMSASSDTPYSEFVTFGTAAYPGQLLIRDNKLYLINNSSTTFNANVQVDLYYCHLSGPITL